jgi:hypothetical protein
MNDLKTKVDELHELTWWFLNQTHQYCEKPHSLTWDGLQRRIIEIEAALNETKQALGRVEVRA